MLDFHDATLRNRLRRAVEESYSRLEPYRSLALKLIEEYAGSGYGSSKVKGGDTYLNLMKQAIEAYTMLLAANRPQILVSTSRAKLRPFANHFQQAVNNLLREINIEVTCREWLINAFFSLGVIKVHLSDSPMIEVEDNVWMDPGSPFASNVSIDDFVFDTAAKRSGECKFFGDMYRISFDDIKREPYDQSVVSEYDLQPTSKFTDDTGERIEKISQGYETDKDEFEPMIDLCDIYFPRERMIYTFAVKSRTKFQIYGKPLAAMEWTGGEGGPYHMLSFIDVPENVMPASMADQLAPLHRGVNNIMRKQFRKAQRQKDVHTYTAGGSDDAKRLQRSSDGEWVRVNDPTEIGLVQDPGVNPGNQQFMLNAIELFDRMGGNLTAILGLGKQASTLGQEELIHSASSRMESHMQIRYVSAIRGVIEDLGKLLWEDQFKIVPGEVFVPGAPEFRADATWTPDEREGEFEDYSFDVDVYNLPYMTPQQRLQQIQQVLIQVIAPMMPFLQQQGGTIDMQQLISVFSELMGEPRLLDIVQFAVPMGADEEGGVSGQDAVRKPPSGTREYVRRNVSEGNSGSGSMAQDWAGSMTEAGA